ncbi:DoxX family protein [Chelatococcus asaccharovorans]|uniref:Putative oxidoreductase n=1 Tax=Chelatococcus asaccharovorans TaxID=28210 RepID=A0A2V3U3Z9_9HYPH|nr:DoxX family protein [Chelatococcus asaccharovorans]MBS7702978.1 DoxX family protein [Chelatococcus asaccharovorans]PXW57277.1 putative oxidoreductase [Chelatococcus asaccharovorans]
MKPSSDLAALVLRLSLGGMYLAHSIVLKVLTYGFDGTAAFFVKAGLPGWLAYVTITGEVLGGVLLILGLQTRWVVVALSPALLGAIIWVHAANGWVFTAPGGGWEYPAFLLAVSFVQFLLGDGAYAVSRVLAGPRSITEQP